ncbi:MAG: RNA polymerase sigma factor [Pirellula sp.]|nr:RNA polymerase sigma factor [Pirellula sp.]
MPCRLVYEEGRASWLELVTIIFQQCERDWRIDQESFIREYELSEKPEASELLRLAKQGDFQAFQTLVSELQPRVYGLAYRMLHQSQDAEDVTQQTFVSMIEHLKDFREESSVATWALKIASNFALKILRRRKGHAALSLDDGREDGYADMPHPEYIAPWRRPPDDIAADAEVQREIRSALEHLDDKYRTVFVMRDIEGFSVRDTAEALGLTESAVKVRLLRARLALREILTRRFGDESQVMIPDHQHG